MITVKFYGITRLLLKQGSVDIEAENVDELLTRLGELYPQVKLEDFRNCVILVNGTNIVNLKVYKTKLKHGDEVQLFSPVAGG